MKSFTLDDLEQIVAQRANASPDHSYTAKLLLSGSTKAAQKLGEEAVEAAIAAVQNDQKALVSEAADVLYHLLVLLHSQNISLSEVLTVLEKRTVQSGLEEKASRDNKTAAS